MTSQSDSNQPLLKLALAGFGADGRNHVERSLERHTGSVRWGLCPLAEADAWLVNGPQVQVLPDGSLRVLPARPVERAVRLDLCAMDRPVAFCGPLPPEVDPLCTLDLSSPASTEAALLRLSNWLLATRAHYLLGRQIVAQGAALRHGVFHLSVRERLLAVLNFRTGTAALMPQVHPGDLATARWDRRPPNAGASPPGFTIVAIRQLCWVYASRTDEDLLPSQYHHARIYFRQPPRVLANQLRDTHLMLLSELSKQPGTLVDLGTRTGLLHAQLVRDLASLYFGGAITTTSAKAAQPRRRLIPAVSSRPMLDEMIRDDAPSQAGRLTAPGTVPMTLSTAHGSRASSSASHP